MSRYLQTIQTRILKAISDLIDYFPSILVIRRIKMRNENLFLLLLRKTFYYISAPRIFSIKEYLPLIVKRWDWEWERKAARAQYSMGWGGAVEGAPPPFASNCTLQCTTNLELNNLAVLPVPGPVPGILALTAPMVHELTQYSA